jgi:hypothetical protein
MASRPPPRYTGPALPVYGISVVVPHIPIPSDKLELRPRVGRPRDVDRVARDRLSGHVQQQLGAQSDSQIMQDGWQLYQRLAEGLEYAVLRSKPWTQGR